MLRAGVGGEVSGEARYPGLLCGVGRVCCLVPGEHPGMSWVQAGPPGSAPETSIFCASPGAASALQLPVPRSWRPGGGNPVSHTSATPTGAACLPACQLLPSCANPPEAFASPDSLASRSDGSSVLAGLQAAKPRGTSAPAEALPVPAAAGLLGCAVGGIGGSPRQGPIMVPAGWDGAEGVAQAGLAMLRCWWDASDRARSLPW